MLGILPGHLYVGSGHCSKDVLSGDLGDCMCPLRPGSESAGPAECHPSRIIHSAGHSFHCLSALAAVLQNVPVATGGTINLSTFWWAVRHDRTALDSLIGISLIKSLDLT